MFMYSIFVFQNSLMSTIINLAQNFVGSNNLNLLQPLGQFGTRLHGGKDAASPRYIFTMLRYSFCCDWYSKQVWHGDHFRPLAAVSAMLTLLLLNTTCPVLANSVDPDQLASS